MRSGRGGKRLGAGRPAGSINFVTRDLLRRLNEAPGANVFEKLVAVTEDPATPPEVVLCGLRHAFGYLTAKRLALPGRKA